MTEFLPTAGFFATLPKPALQSALGEASCHIIQILPNKSDKILLYKQLTLMFYPSETVT